MMINPGSNDSTAVFALLAAVASPEAAKASLQEILDASTELQKAKDAFEADKKQSYAEVNAMKDDAEAKLATAQSISDNFDKKYAKQSKEIADRESSVSAREFAIQVTESNQNERETQLKTLANQLNAKAVDLSNLEKSATELMATAESMVQDYSGKLSELKAITA
jgi:chromosome segregation ATPase